MEGLTLKKMVKNINIKLERSISKVLLKREEEANEMNEKERKK